jgi:hypothetical protein
MNVWMKMKALVPGVQDHGVQRQLKMVFGDN